MMTKLPKWIFSECYNRSQNVLKCGNNCYSHQAEHSNCRNIITRCYFGTGTHLVFSKITKLQQNAVNPIPEEYEIQPCSQKTQDETKIQAQKNTNHRKASTKSLGIILSIPQCTWEREATKLLNKKKRITP